MYRLTVLYGQPDDPVAFDDYYQGTHVPLARHLPGLRGWTIAKCEPTRPGETPPYYAVVDLYTDDRDALLRMLASAEGRAVAADVGNFATGGATYLHQQDQVLIPQAGDPANV